MMDYPLPVVCIIEPKSHQPHILEPKKDYHIKGCSLESIGRFSPLDQDRPNRTCAWAAPSHSKVANIILHERPTHTPSFLRTLSDQTAVSTPTSPPKWLRPEQDSPSKTAQTKTTADQSVLSMTTFSRGKLSQKKSHTGFENCGKFSCYSFVWQLTPTTLPTTPLHACSGSPHSHLFAAPRRPILLRHTDRLY